MKKFYVVLLMLLFWGVQQGKAQGGFSFSCARDTIITDCSVSCITLQGVIPDFHAPGTTTTTYAISQITGAGIPNSCFRNPVDPSTPGLSGQLTRDDQYDTLARDLGFTFPFYGVNYTKVVLSTNGYLSFDVSLATNPATFSHWSAAAGNLPNTGYDRALIMGPYHDLDISVPHPATTRVKYEILGVSPYKRFVFSFYNVPLFSTACNSLIKNTHQIVLYEGTGMIDVIINDMQICSGWNGGKAMIGLQDFTRTQGITVPGRGALSPPWGSVGMNETWRFFPGANAANPSAAGPTLYRGVELVDFSGNVVSVGDTIRIGTTSNFKVSFPNVCPSTTTSYLIKTKYESSVTPGSFFYGTDTVRVVRTQAIRAPAIVTPVLCNGATNGIIVINAAGGTAGGPFQYSIDGGALTSSNTFTNLSGGPHLVHVEETGSICRKDTTIIINEPAVIQATASATDATCVLNTGVITVNATGGTRGLHYSINGGPFQDSNIFSEPPGSYTITVKDDNGCTINVNNVTVNLAEEITLTGDAGSSVCSGVPVTLGIQSNAATFSWSPSAGLDHDDIINPIASPTISTSYTVTATLGSCVRTFTIPITIIQNVSVDAGATAYTTTGGSVQLQGSVTNADSYEWTPSSSLSSATVLNPVASPVTTTLYTLTAHNSLGCSASDTVSVIVIPYCVRVRNAFTPNGDGINDTWKVYDDFDCLQNVTVRVFNRYGNKVYENRNYRNSWDGRYKGNPVPDGTYYGVIDFLMLGGKTVTIRTDISVLR